MKSLAFVHRILRALVFLLAAALSPFLWAADVPSTEMLTPPRLSLVDQAVSFWRSGAENWTPAQVNTPLARGDALYTGDTANLEIQVGARAFVRAGKNTMISLVEQTPDFLQFKVTSGIAAFDLRTLATGHSVEVDTPNAVFSIDRPGYYRLDILGDSSHFITRRGGRATVTLPDGQGRSLAPSEEAVVQGASVETYVAPALDAWDSWNYARTEHLLDSISQRYVPSDIYGVDDLDAYGSWRITGPYGPVWVPANMAPGWAPYSTGSWIWDPFYGWTWVDSAPWGWAPSHYGRWVFINGYWAWCPGPRVVRPAYAPALVAFFNIGQDSFVRLGLTGPGMGWVALSWGEPVIPWWGGSHFHGVPWWGGWGGPRHEPHGDYHNASVGHGVIAVDNNHFGSGHIHGTHIRIEQDGAHTLPVGNPTVAPRPASLSALHGVAPQPPQAVISKPAFTTHSPRVEIPLVKGNEPAINPSRTEIRLIRRPTSPANEELQSPPFGTLNGPERAQPQLPPPPPRTLTTPSRRVTIPSQPTGTRGNPVENRPAPQQESPPLASKPKFRTPQRETASPEPRANTTRTFPARQERPSPASTGERPAVSRPSSLATPPERASLPGQPANRLYPRDTTRRGGDNR